MTTTTSERRNLGFICIQKDGSRTFGATLLPSEGGYENAQDEVTVLIHKGERYGSPIFPKNGKTVGTICSSIRRMKLGRSWGILEQTKRTAKNSSIYPFQATISGDRKC